VRRIGLVGVALLLLFCAVAVANDFEFFPTGSCSVAFFSNLTGQGINGLILRFANPAPETQVIAIGGDMDVVSIDGGDILLHGSLLPSGTCEVDWSTTGYPLESAAWLVDGNIVQEIDVHVPTARLAIRRGAEDLALVFLAIGSVDPDGLPLARYIWEFDDGVVLEGYCVSRSFPDCGEYTVQLAVSDSEGKEASRTRRFVVGNQPPRPPDLCAGEMQWVHNATVGESEDIMAVHMLSSTDGWAVTLGGKIYRFDGAAWVLNDDLGDGAGLVTVWAVSSTSCWAGGWNHGIYEFDGSDWSLAYSDPDVYKHYVNEIQFLSSSDGWAVGDNGRIYHYDGTEWTVHLSADDWSGEVPDLHGLHMLSDSYGWTAGLHGWSCEFDGNTWRNMGRITTTPSVLVGYGFPAIWVVSPSDVWACDSASGRIFHYDGSSWSMHSATPSGRGINSMAMVSATDGWLVDTGGHFYHYDGTAWTLHTTTDEGTQLLSISMLSETDGWAVGQGGHIYHYECVP